MKRKFLPLVIGCCLGATVVMAFEAGKTAFTKSYETSLLAEPQPLAKTVTNLPFAAAVKITEVKGRWAKVSSDKSDGWIYLGNLAEDKPAKDHGIEGLPTSASATTASVAARPLDNVAKDYASHKGLRESAADVEWLEAKSDAVSRAAVMEFLKAHKRGEFQ